MPFVLSFKFYVGATVNLFFVPGPDPHSYRDIDI